MPKRTPAQYDWATALFNDRRLSKHFTSPRRGKIKHVTLHHSTIVGTGNGAALETMFNVWQSRQASANYGVDGKHVWQYVSDNDAAWANATSSNHETLSIEHTNSTGAPSWKISDETMATGARLVATLHRLYGLGRPSRKTVKMHRDYYATACPGPYLTPRLNAYIAEAARVYDGATKPTPTTPKPIPVVDPAPQPIAHKDWGKVEVVNHGAATVALKKPSAYAKWLTRRTRLVNITMGKGGIKPDILVGLECGGGSAFTYLTKKYAKGGLVRTKAGTDGREIFVRPSAVTVRETGAIRPTPHKGNDKPAPWIVGTLDGSPIMVVGFHLDPTDPSSEVPLGQAKEIIAAARKIAARLEVPESNLIFLGDAASDDYVRRAAFAATGWLDAFTVAKKKVNAAIASYNRYKAPVVGPSVDGIFVHSTRPVRVVSKRLDSKASDHHVLAAVLERQ